MDIKELEDYRLSDAIKFHTHLNPRIWGRDEHLLPEVREKLMAIAADFKEFLGLDLEVKDITISGSNAAYTYTDHSDIDLHLVTDLPRADASEIYRELFDAKKYQYNDQHNFKIGGYDVELYVQNANENPKSQGIYSVQDNKWISVPKRRKPEVDDISVRSKYEDLGQRIEAAIKLGNREQLDSLGRKIREFRQAGLDKTGEFGPENLAFKILRSNGTLDQLRAARLAARDQELSIEEAKKKKKKKAFRYGFGGVFFPGYHYYGQTDAAADGGGGDGGGESVKESAVFLNPNAVIVGQDHNKPLNLSPDTLKKVQAIAAKHGARYEGNGKDRTYTKGQIDKYVGSWDDEVAKTAGPNDPKWLYVLFANVDENNRVQRVGVDAQDTIFNRLLATAKDNSFQGIGFTSQALQKFLSMASEGKYDFVNMSQQPATQENLTRFLKAGESLMWPSNWEQYPNKAGKIAKAATVDVRDQYLATRKAGVYVTGSGHLKAVQDITGQQGVTEDSYKDTGGTFMDRLVGEIMNYHSMHDTYPKLNDFTSGVKSKLKSLGRDKTARLFQQALKQAAEQSGQTGVAEESKGIRESADDLQTQLEKFAAFCVKKLGIENPPGIQLKRDPEWSRRNATFGRYVPGTNVMILSVADRHPMDIMRTLAHELVHRNQDEYEPMPVHAGETGSDWENEANAKAGVLMRDFGEQNPDTFDKKALAEGELNEYRDALYTFVKSKFPTWPEYVLKDFLYPQAKGIRNQAELDDFLKRINQEFGNCKWTLTKLPITMDIFTPKTQQMIKSREGGSSNPFQVPRDAERHAQQSKMIQQKGVSTEPIIVAKLSNGYDLIEGWHRTIQHLKTFPEGYTGPAWVCTGATYKSESVNQGVAEASEQSLSSMVAQDQAERNEYSQFVKSQAGGDWTKGAKMYAQLKKRPSDDIFNDAARLNQFMKMTFDFDKFTDQDWDNYWLLAQHSDDHRDFQKNALSIIKKYQGTDHLHYKYLYDRISCGLTGKQKYGTQDICGTDNQVVAEASGYIPVTDAEAKDPRYSMAITQDIRPGEVKRQAAKLGWKTTPAGTPPTARTNGLVEELTRKLQLVKEGLGFPLVSEQEQELDEVAMSPSALQAFAASPAAAGMKAGFEAELVFTGIGGDEEEGEWEPDYSYDPRAYSLENIEDFFSSGDFAEGLSRRQKNALEEDWMDWYDQTLYDEFDAPVAVREWIQENDWDEEDLIERALDDEYSEDRVKEILAAMERRVRGTGTAADADLVEEYVGARQEVERQLDERVDLAIEDQNSDYESALDEFRENWDRSESDWLRDRGWTNMSDLAYNFDFAWPHMTMSGGSSEGGFNEEAAQQLADSLSEALGVETTVSTGYHGATRDTSTWIFEPDGSLDADDDANMPVEIVSPPMPLAKTLEILPKFFEWAEENGAYANSSTGFHMSVSMPDHEGNLLDYTKLALFLGDEYVLQQFGREANTYAKSALQKIREKKGNVNAEEILSTMRKHLGHFASRALAQPSGFGKYTSINPKTNYIEFRSAGGSNYFEDMDRIQNTLMRYARAMDIAFDPDADKPEYAKKLYKLLTDTKTQQVTDPKTGTKRTEVVPGLDNDAISIFSRFVAGELPKSELKGVLKKLQYGREVAKNPPKEKIQWQVTHPNGSSLIKVSASSSEEAIKIAKQEWGDSLRVWPDSAYRAEPVVPATQTPATDQLNAPAADDPGGNYVLRRREGSEGVGPVVHRFSAPNNMAAVEASRQWTTARGVERRSVWLDHISGVPPEILNARPVSATLGEPRPAFTEPRSSSIPEVPLDIAQNFQEPPASWDSGSPIVSEPQNFPAAGNSFSGEWKVVDGLGREVHRFGGIGNSQSDANRVAAQWARQTGFDGNLEVYPVMR